MINTSSLLGSKTDSQAAIVALGCVPCVTQYTVPDQATLFCVIQEQSRAAGRFVIVIIDIQRISQVEDTISAFSDIFNINNPKSVTLGVLF